jgi:hypothetical protein
MQQGLPRCTQLQGATLIDHNPFGCRLFSPFLSRAASLSSQKSPQDSDFGEAYERREYRDIKINSTKLHVAEQSPCGHCNRRNDFFLYWLLVLCCLFRSLYKESGEGGLNLIPREKQSSSFSPGDFTHLETKKIGLGLAGMGKASNGISRKRTTSGNGGVWEEGGKKSREAAYNTAEIAQTNER